MSAALAAVCWKHWSIGMISEPAGGVAAGVLDPEVLRWMRGGGGNDAGGVGRNPAKRSRWMAERLGRVSPSRVVQAVAGNGELPSVIPGSANSGGGGASAGGG